MANGNLIISCNFCGNPNPIYYCNKCNVVFCSKCKKEEVKDFIFCASCGVIITEVQKNNQELEPKYKCPGCKSKKYILGQKKNKHCPGCNEDNIIPIAEKKRNLIETSRRTIFKFRYGYKEFYSFLVKLDRLKSNIINLRSSGFFHDPRIEAIILKIIRSIPLVKKQILFRAEQDHKILKQALQKFLEPSKWTPHKFFLLEASLSQIKEIMKNFKLFVDELRDNLYKALKIATRKIKAISYYKRIYDRYEPLLEILPGELPICAFKKIKFKKCSFRSLKSSKGILFLTDRRMIFLRKKGFLFKKHKFLFDFFLEGFKTVEITGKIFKRLKFSLPEGEVKFSASEKVMRAIINYFKISINFDKYRIDGEISPEIMVPIDLDIIDLKQKIELIITSLLSLNQTSYLIRNSDQLDTTSFETPLTACERGNCSKNASEIKKLLFKFQGEEFSLQNTLRNLEHKFSQRIISPEEYLRQFRHLQSELFSVRKKIDKIQRRSNNNSDFDEIINQINYNLRTGEYRAQFNHNLQIEENKNKDNEESGEKRKSRPVPLNIFDM